MFLGLTAALSACLNTNDLADDIADDVADDVAGDIANEETRAAGNEGPVLLAAGPAWQRPSFIPSATTSSAPGVAVDASGSAIAVWRSGSDLLASHYVPAASSWSQPIVIDSASTDLPHHPMIAFDSAKRAIVVWEQRSEVWANRFVPGTGWGTATRLSATGASTVDPDLAVRSNGDAVVVWSAPLAPGGMRVHARRFLAANGAWEATQLVDPEGTASSYQASVTVDGQGNAIAIWLNHGGGSGSKLEYSRFVPASGWSVPLPLVTNYSAFVRARVVADNTGNAVVVYSASAQSIKARRFTPNGGWGAPQTVSIDGAAHPLASPVLALAGNASGNVVAVWQESDGNRPIMSSRFTPANGWAAPVEIYATPDGDTSFATDLSIALDAANRSHLVWKVYDGSGGQSSNIWASGFVGTEAWRTAQIISGSPLPAVSPAVAIGPGGAALAIWAQGIASDERKVVTARYN